MKLVKTFIVYAALALLGACDSSPDLPASLAGGGFIFNYRLGEAYYGVVINATRSMPDGAVLSAEFEDPAGGPAIVINQAAQKSQQRYMFRTPALKGIKKDVPYHVAVRVLDGPNGKELQKIEHSYKSDFDESIIAGGPLVIGPCYTPNPENDITKPTAN